MGPMGLLLRVIASIVLIHLGWYLYERWRFAAAVGAIHARGEPVLVEDFNRPAAGDPEDPVPYWREAAAAVGDDVLGALKVNEVQLPLTRREMLKFREMVEANRLVLQRAGIASAKTGSSDWSYQFTVLSFDDSHPDLNPQRCASRAICMRAFYEHEMGDDAGAVEAVEIVLRQQGALYLYPDYMGHLTALDSGWKACVVLWQIAPTLRIESDDSAEGRAVPAGQVRKLIDKLLDERALGQSVREVCRAWRMQAASDSIHLFSTEKEWWIRTIATYVWAPRGYRDATNWLDAATQMMNAASERCWPDCEAQLVRLEARPDLKRSVFDSRVYTWQRGLRQDYLYRAGSRLTAVALAARLYATEHEGELPAALDRLVPRYLQFVPADPMATGGPLRYRGGDDPVVYSVGQNGIDDGGSDAVIDDRDSKYFNCERDIVLHLRGEKRTVPEDYFVHDGLQYRYPVVVPMVKN
jgi:hypothetical protein